MSHWNNSEFDSMSVSESRSRLTKFGRDTYDLHTRLAQQTKRWAPVRVHPGCVSPLHDQQQAP